MVKLDGLHLPVFGDARLPTGTLAVPAAVLEATRFTHPPTVTEILVARAERAARLLEWLTPYEPAQPAAP